MKRMAIASAVLMAAVASGAVATLPAAAQRNREPLSANQIADQVDARIAKLKADLRLNDDQSKNWGSLQAALHDIAVARANRYLQRAQAADTQGDSRSAPQPGADGRDRSRIPDEIERMRREADFQTDRAADLRKFADAAGPLYSSLDDNQKRRFIQYLRSARGDERDPFREDGRRFR
jgi:hypothetical protein